MKIAKVIKAPAAAGQEIGELRLKLGEDVAYRAPLVALADAEEAGVFSQMGDFIYLFFSDLFSSD